MISAQITDITSERSGKQSRTKSRRILQGWERAHSFCYLISKKDPTGCAKQAFPLQLHLNKRKKKPKKKSQEQSNTVRTHCWNHMFLDLFPDILLKGCSLLDWKKVVLKACFSTPVWSGSTDCEGVVFMSKYSDKRMNHVLEFLMQKIKSQFKLEWFIVWTYSIREIWRNKGVLFLTAYGPKQESRMSKLFFRNLAWYPIFGAAWQLDSANWLH